MVERKRIDSRDDLLKVIEGNGGKAEGLDLSRAIFKEGIDLSEMDLTGIILRGAQLIHSVFNGSDLSFAILNDANLQHAKFNPGNSKFTNLEGADLRGTILLCAEFKEANLSCAKFGQSEARPYIRTDLEKTDFQGANLFKAEFDECFFYGTKLQGAYVRGADLEKNAHLEEADWGNYVIGEEKSKQYGFAETYYRRFKMWYNANGMYDVAAKFYYREMEAKRKSLRWWLARREWWLRWWPLRGEKLRLNVYGLLCGYGERPWQVFLAAAVIIFGLAGFYTWLGSFASKTFPNCLYYSAVSFTALGYGQWAPQPSGWAKGMGAAEAVIGVFMIALFLVTFTRKMVR